MERMLHHSTCERFVTDCKDMITMITDPQAWPNFSTELEVIQILQMCFPDFKISYFTRAQNRITDSLARNARFFVDFFALLIVLFRSGYPDQLKFE